jgi:subtilisin family serine protease
MSPLKLVRLYDLMKLGKGRLQIRIAVIDGPVVLDHPDLTDSAIREIPGKLNGFCTRVNTLACTHGTSVVGILSARRGSAAPAICPGCTLLLRPIFAESADGSRQMPTATPGELAEAIIDSVDARANVINLSSALVQSSPMGESRLVEALNYAAHRGVITVAAAGNQGTVGSTVITAHPWVIPVAACDSCGKPLRDTNLGSSIGRRGLSAPGENIASLGTHGKPWTFGGTSAAAPFVTGTIGLLWSQFPNASAAQIRLAVTQSGGVRRTTVSPPVLNAWTAYQSIATVQGGLRAS